MIMCVISIVLLVYRIRKRINVVACAEMVGLPTAMSFWLLIVHQRNAVVGGTIFLSEATTASMTRGARLAASIPNTKDAFQ